jgi:AcrR family transcriptional regulator
MAQHRDNARESILTAFQELLVETGGPGATLDEVARRAGVTKGGLLYHFASRGALEEALMDRLEALAADEAAHMSTVPEGAAAYYVSLAEYLNSPLDRATLAVGKLVSRSARAREITRGIRKRSFDLLNADLGDPALARAAMLIADGMYYDATTIGEPFEHELDVNAFLRRMIGRP